MTLQGSLDTFPLPDVLRLLAGTGKTGGLLVVGPVATGGLWLVDGRIEHAAIAGNRCPAVDAFVQLLRNEHGSFTFEAGHPPATAADDAGEEPVEVEVLLAEADERFAEWQALRAAVPGDDPWLTLCPSPAAEVVMTGGQWDAVVGIGAGVSFRSLVALLAVGELETLRRLAGLHELGLLDVAEPAPASAADDAAGEEDAAGEAVAAAAPVADDAAGEAVAAAAPQGAAEPAAATAEGTWPAAAEPAEPPVPEVVAGPLAGPLDGGSGSRADGEPAEVEAEEEPVPAEREVVAAHPWLVETQVAWEHGDEGPAAVNPGWPIPAARLGSLVEALEAATPAPGTMPSVWQVQGGLGPDHGAVPIRPGGLDDDDWADAERETAAVRLAAAPEPQDDGSAGEAERAAEDQAVVEGAEPDAEQADGGFDRSVLLKFLGSLEG